MSRQDTALLLDCRSLAIRPVSIRDSGIELMIINTRIRHKNAETEYAHRREQCMAAAEALGVKALRDATMPMLNAARSRMPTVVFRRARHVITENERTLKTAAAIEESDWPTVGKMMYASHDSLRDDYEVSSMELDAVVEIARKLGAKDGIIGCRMTGAGFGGSAVALVKAGAVLHLTRKISEAYEEKTGEQAEIFATRPSAGARILSPTGPR
jgi:galactokinase